MQALQASNTTAKRSYVRPCSALCCGADAPNRTAAPPDAAGAAEKGASSSSSAAYSVTSSAGSTPASRCLPWPASSRRKAATNLQRSDQKWLGCVTDTPLSCSHPVCSGAGQQDWREPWAAGCLQGQACGRAAVECRRVCLQDAQHCTGTKGTKRVGPQPHTHPHSLHSLPAARVQPWMGGGSGRVRKLLLLRQLSGILCQQGGGIPWGHRRILCQLLPEGRHPVSAALRQARWVQRRSVEGGPSKGRRGGTPRAPWLASADSARCAVPPRLPHLAAAAAVALPLQASARALHAVALIFWLAARLAI